MLAIKSKDVDRLRKAGDVVEEESPPAKPGVDPQVQALSAQVADIAARISTLDKAQLAAVLGAAQQAQKNTSELAVMLTTLLKDRPPQKKEKWRLTVIERDHTGLTSVADLQQLE